MFFSEAFEIIIDFKIQKIIIKSILKIKNP